MAQTKGANVKREKQLTLREERFVAAMADPRTKSNTEAALKAGYSPKNSRIIAAQNLTKLYISDAICERKQRALAHALVTPEEVLGSAVYQMRSSISDVFDDVGSFDYQKAVETGAVDLIKKHKETTRTIYNKEGGCEVVKTVEVEMLTNQDGRKEVANYIGLEQFAPKPESKIERYATITRKIADKLGVTIEETLRISIELGEIPAEFVEEVRRRLLGDGSNQ